MAERIIPTLQPTPKKARKKGEGDGHPWQRRYRSFRAKLKSKPKPEPQQEQPGPVMPDLETAEHQAAEQLTRPAVNHNRPLFGPTIS